MISFSKSPLFLSIILAALNGVHGELYSRTFEGIPSTTDPFIIGHPGEEHEHMGPAELSARQLAANARHVQARNCAPAMASMAAERRKRRDLKVKRQAGATSTLTGNTLKPSATAISNYNCITAPEVTEGPYYIRNEFVRQDIRGGQSGIPLQLEIGVIDTTTCKPLPGAYVELWHANAAGAYGGFSSGSSGGGGGGGGARPTTTAGGSSGGSTGLTETFLRGGWPTNNQGIVDLMTIFPGYYSGRTTHIHMMVHTNYTIAANGTIVSSSGSLVHIGQLFFEESLNNQVFATSPYSSNTNTRTTNAQDSILAQESANGNDAYVDAVLTGSSITNGLFGYINVGVSSSAHYTITTSNYNAGSL